MAELPDVVAAFIDAACVPLDSGHASGTLDRAEAIRAAHPEISSHDVYAAAVLGDDATVRAFLARKPTAATATGGPRGWDALTYLCFSRYLQHDQSRSDGFVRAATALLDAGASARTGWFETHHQPEPEWESVLYGAAGVSHHPELTRLLLERGADPNDIETVYHTPESYDNRALKVLVETNALTPDSLALILVRKHDWHDYEGIKWLLERGVDPNLQHKSRWSPLHHALARDNDIAIITLLLEHGANPALQLHGTSAIALTARRGRADVLALFRDRGIPVALHGVEELIAACALNDTTVVRTIATREPALVAELVAQGGKLLAEFAGNGNTTGVEALIGLGVNVNARFEEGDGYFDVARQSTALHVAAWRARHDTVRRLLELGASVNLPDGAGRTPLALAIRACVDSYWTNRRSPESVELLLRAGASVAGVSYPTGYAEVDQLLARSAPIARSPR